MLIEDLDDLDTDTPAFVPLRPFAELVAERRAMPAHDMARKVFDDSTGRISTDSTPALLMRLNITTDPATAWLMHCELTARNVPPVLRHHHHRHDSRQLALLPVIADMQWAAEKHTGHKPTTPRADALFTRSTASVEWGRLALQVYKWNRGHSWAIAAALGLTEDMRRPLETLKSRQQADDRRAYKKAKSRIHSDLLNYATKHPDKNGATSPNDLVSRQLLLLNCYLLCNRNAAYTAAMISETTSAPIKRRMITQQIDRIKQRSGAAHRLCGDTHKVRSQLPKVAG